MTQAELESRLFDIAQRKAASAGRKFGQGAGPDIQALVGRGAAQIVAIADPVERSSLQKEAEKQIERLIDLMIEETKRIPGYPNGLLGEQTLHPALLRFCPCRPFC